ncbi:MAG: hypothetical protein ABR969_06415 [Sedimentisphaerales bacterium]|jgi:hypothetical protein
MTKKLILTVLAGITLLAVADNTLAWGGPHGGGPGWGHGGYHHGGGFHWGIDIGVLIAPPLVEPVYVYPPREVIVTQPVVVVPPPVTTVVEERSVVVWVANDNGSRTQVTLVKTENGGYMGPKGEYYSNMPSNEQLRTLYGIRTERAKQTPITVWITNDNGSQTPVTLTPSGVGFTGPSDEYYPSMPTEEQLRASYGLRSNAPVDNTVTVWLENIDGTKIPVVLTKEGSDYVGPKGEHYSEIPTQEQLKVIYSEKPKKIASSSTVVWISSSDGSKTPITLQKQGSSYLGPAGEKYASLPSEEQLKLLYSSDANGNEQSELNFQVTKDDGSKTVVILKKEGSEFVGPKGERYPSMPTQEQLKLIYGK